MSEIRKWEEVRTSRAVPSAGSEPRAQWFAVYTVPRHEKHVSEMLTERRIETLLPLYRATRQWKKSSPVVLDLPLFPTYVFVRCRPQDRGSVLGTPGVISIVGSPREPWPLSDLEIDVLRCGLAERKAEPHPYLAVGERVRIKTGVMTGVEGVLIRKKSDLRVVLNLDTIMRSVAIEVDSQDIDPLCPPLCPPLRAEVSGPQSAGSNRLGLAPA